MATESEATAEKGVVVAAEAAVLVARTETVSDLVERIRGLCKGETIHK